MEIVAIIPARYGSSRFPGKPLAQIAGKPMIQRVYELAKQVPELKEVYVATDDDRIVRCVQSIGGRSILTGQEHLSGSDRLAEAAEKIGLPADAIVVNIQGDQLVFPTPLISELIASLRADPAAALATPVKPFSDPHLALNPNVVKAVFDRQNYAMYFSRSAIPYFRDDATPCYFKHIGIYVYRHDFLQRFVNLPAGSWETAEKLEQLRALEYGFKIRLVQTDGETVEVDTPEDARQAEIFCKRSAVSSQLNN